MDGVYGCVGVMIYYLLRCEYEYVHVVMYEDVLIASRNYIRGLRQNVLYQSVYASVCRRHHHRSPQHPKDTNATLYNRFKFHRSSPFMVRTIH